MKDKKFVFEAFKKQMMLRLKEGKGLAGAEGAFTRYCKFICPYNTW